MLCLLGQCKTVLCVCKSRVNVNDLYFYTFKLFILILLASISFFLQWTIWLAYHPKHNKISSPLLSSPLLPK